MENTFSNAYHTNTSTMTKSLPHMYSHRESNFVLTHGDRDKMVYVLQTPFSNAFSSLKRNESE